MNIGSALPQRPLLMVAPSGNRRTTARRGGAIYGSGGDGGLGPLMRTIGLVVLVILLLVLIAKNCTGGDSEEASLQDQVELQLALAAQSTGDGTVYEGVDVTITDKTVVLTGEVPTNADKLNAKQAALRTDGIEDVVDNLTVAAGATPPGPGDVAGLQNQLNELVLAEPIQFTVGSAELEAESNTTLDRVAQAISSSDGVIIEIRGYTDSQGDSDENRILSQERADTVRQYLIDRGVEAISLSSVGLGEANPIADNETEEGRARNRRIEFVVT
ncbi:MAG: OmpA family protein [Acidimicrobiales bacterium]|nr:OmpA family protein [Acidimicrobiales bacterium]